MVDPTTVEEGGRELVVQELLRSCGERNGEREACSRARV